MNTAPLTLIELGEEWLRVMRKALGAELRFTCHLCGASATEDHHPGCEFLLIDTRLAEVLAARENK